MCNGAFSCLLSLHKTGVRSVHNFHFLSTHGAPSLSINSSYCSRFKLFSFPSPLKSAIFCIHILNFNFSMHQAFHFSLSSPKAHSSVFYLSIPYLYFYIFLLKKDFHFRAMRTARFQFFFIFSGSILL